MKEYFEGKMLYGDDFTFAEIKKWYPQAQVEVMSHNNPGFDILVTEQSQVIRYIDSNSKSKTGLRWFRNDFQAFLHEDE